MHSHSHSCYQQYILTNVFEMVKRKLYYMDILYSKKVCTYSVALRCISTLLRVYNIAAKALCNQNEKKVTIILPTFITYILIDSLILLGLVWFVC